LSANNKMLEKEFWKNKPFEEFSKEEWEAVCDHCGLCCLLKFIDEDTDELIFTYIACKYFNSETCTCTDYESRSINVPTCISMTPDKAKKLNFLADSCAYKLLAEGKDLPEWHHLNSGSYETVHEAEISIKGKAVPEQNIHHEDIEQFFIPPKNSEK